MKVTVDKVCCDFECGNEDCGGAFGTKEIDIEITTADLIAELEERMPCNGCANNNVGNCGLNCVWNGIFLYDKDNFTPAGKAKEGPLSAAVPAKEGGDEGLRDSLEAWEDEAEAFYKATGMLRPGKDIAAASGWTEEREKERQKAYKIWCAGWSYRDSLPRRPKMARVKAWAWQGEHSGMTVHYIQGRKWVGKSIDYGPWDRDRSPCGSTKLTDSVSINWPAVTCQKCLKLRPKAKAKGKK